jgi:hypothetical protein
VFWPFFHCTLHKLKSHIYISSFFIYFHLFLIIKMEEVAAWIGGVVLVVLLAVVLLLLTAWLHPRWLLRFISWATLPQRVIFFKSSSPSSSSPSSSSSSSSSEHEPLISSGPATQRRRRVAITIDDAPHGEVTPYLLDELRRHECRATFFCIGAQVAAAPKALLRRMVDEGHELGNHMMHDMAT